MNPARTLVPLRLVLPLVVASCVGEIAAWALAMAPGTLDPGWYGRGALLAAVHALTLGTLATAIVGVGWQVTTVIVAAGWGASTERLVPWIGRALIVGIPLLLAGFSGWGGDAGVGLVVGALALRAVLVGRMLLRQDGRTVTRLWIAAAELSLLAGLGVAVGLWSGRAGHPVFADPIAAVRMHVLLLLGGWLGGWIVAAGSLLLPMFAVAKEPSPRLLGAAGIVWFGALWTGHVPVLGAVLAAGALGVSLVRGVRSGPALRQAAFGLGMGGVAVLAPLPADARVALLLVGGALPILRGVSQRIVPFLLWNHAMSAVAPADLVPARGAWIQFGLSAAGALGVVAGRLYERADIGIVGAALAFVGAVLHVGLLVGAWWRVEREQALQASRRWAPRA